MAAQAQTVDLGDFVGNIAQCHPQLISAQSRVGAAQASTEEVTADRLPTFSVSGGAFRNDDGSDDTQASLTATMPIISFGRQGASEAVSQAELHLANAEYERIVSDHVRRLIELWTRRDATLRRIDIFDESLTEKQLFIEVIERRASQGVSSEAELRDAQSEYVADVTEQANLQLSLIDIESDILTLGCEDGDLQRIVWATPPIEVSTVSVQTHPEYLVSLAELRVARDELRFAELANNPTLNVQARTGVDQDQDVSSRIGLTFDYEYQSFGRSRRASLQQAELVVREAESAVRFSQINLDEEIYANVQRISHLQTNVVTAIQNELDNFETTLASSRRRYEANRITVREVLADINNIKQTRLEFVDAQEQTSLIYNDLMFAAGLYVN